MTIILTLALPLVLTSCAMDYRASELPYENLIKQAKSVTASSGNGIDAVDRTVSTCWSPKNTYGDWLEIEFKRAITFNAISIKEKNCSVKVFKLEIPDGEGWKTIYYSDGIGNYRLCSIDTATASKVRFTVENAFDRFCIRELAIYNINETMPDNFQKTAFINVARYSEMASLRPAELNEFLLFYDDIILTDVIIAQSNGSLSYAVDINALKTIVADIKAVNNTKVSINIVNNAAANPINNRVNCDALIDNILKLNAATDASVTLHWQEIAGAEIWRAYNFIIKNLSGDFDKITATDKHPTLGIILDNSRVELKSNSCKALDKVYFLGTATSGYGDVYNDFYNNLYSATNLLDELGFDKSKIVLTMPLCSKSLSSNTDTMPYAQLIKEYEHVNPWQNLYININSNGSYKDFYFQSPLLARDKAIYTKALGLGGFGVVGLAFDMPISHPLSITNALANALK